MSQMIEIHDTALGETIATTDVHEDETWQEAAARVYNEVRGLTDAPEIKQYYTALVQQVYPGGYQVQFGYSAPPLYDSTALDHQMIVCVKGVPGTTPDA